MSLTQELASWGPLPQLAVCSPPVAEATFLALRTASATHPSINFLAISHSSQSSTDKWIAALGGTGPSLTVLVDNERQMYAKWGLGVSSWGHVLSPAGLMGIWMLGKEKGIWNRPTESGSWWQTGVCVGDG
ncbi:hypothetical protein N7539_008314 [Penicillium diatomitis]|uniref:Uncharacterized protein n=1 Tax=Penicillium diatomitis TaxID=2819901 RepID=A0A9W9WTM0_9EURO|nr:uncharacterized protein N7539_008314 [Penicillium diatomitis]KAJ5475248.1 hypothetical protein N7539_008314 [Penicillium diatomitis]